MEFHVRKHYVNENKDVVVTSEGFVCGNEGLRGKDNINHIIKKPQLETRTSLPCSSKTEAYK
jgi:hypothetical protein